MSTALPPASGERLIARLATRLGAASGAVTGSGSRVLVAGGVVAVLVLALADLSSGAPAGGGLLLAVYFVVLVLGERFRLRLRGRLETAPTAAGAAVALASTTALPDGPAGIRTWEVLATIAAAQLVDWALVRRRLPAGERLDVAADGVLRILTAGLVSATLRNVPLAQGATIEQRLPEWSGPVQACVLLAVVGAALVVEVPLRARFRWRTGGMRRAAAVREEFGSSFGLAVALATCGVIIALVEPVLGIPAVPVLLLLLASVQAAVRRQAATARALLQSITAMSRLPELSGAVSPGHAATVADLSVAVGRELQMRDRDVATLEYAAYLHDIGQVALDRPVPGGATVLAAPGDQQRIAEDGAEIVAQTAELRRVADIVRRQWVPYHRMVERRADLPVEARIVKVCNAFDDYRRVAPAAQPLGERSADALQRLYLGLGYEFDPRVVAALERVVERAAPAGHLRGTGPRSA